MTRLKIETPVPAGTEVADARNAAKLAACEALGIHIVEEACTTAPHVPLPREGEDAPNPSPGSIDRVLTTWWDIQR